MSNYRVVFSPYYQTPEQNLQRPPLRIPHLSIAQVTKGKASGESGESILLTVVTKTDRTFRFQVPPSPNLRPHLVHLLNQLCGPKRYPDMFAFQHRMQLGPLDMDGWLICDLPQEFHRMRAQLSTGWRISEANRHFQLCTSYPAVLCVPAGVTDADLVETARFRSSGRLPVLSRDNRSLPWARLSPRGWLGGRSYRHMANGAVIARAAQPKDEEHLRRMVTGGPEAKLHIFDCRPYLSAMGNSFRKGGFETGAGYPFAQLHFLNIDNIVAMREAHRKLVELCSDPLVLFGDRFYSTLEQTKWPFHSRVILSGVAEVVRAVQDGQSVLVHCSDGWDRTPQVVSAAMVVLDPYCRRLEGFETLIEKEWLHMGHRFATRLGTGVHGEPLAERCPVFTQFLDCIYQLMCQHPTAFQFTERLLVDINKHSLSGLFGTFLCDGDQERARLRLAQQTTSLWTAVNRNFPARYSNPLYVPFDGSLPMDTAPYVFRLWPALHLADAIDPAAVEAAQREALAHQQQLLAMQQQRLAAEAARPHPALGGRPAGPTAPIAIAVAQPPRAPSGSASPAGPAGTPSAASSLSSAISAEILPPVHGPSSTSPVPSPSPSASAFPSTFPGPASAPAVAPRSPGQCATDLLAEAAPTACPAPRPAATAGTSPAGSPPATPTPAAPPPPPPTPAPPSTATATATAHATATATAPVPAPAPAPQWSSDCDEQPGAGADGGADMEPGAEPGLGLKAAAAATITPTKAPGPTLAGGTSIMGASSAPARSPLTLALALATAATPSAEGPPSFGSNRESLLAAIPAGESPAPGAELRAAPAVPPGTPTAALPPRPEAPTTPGVAMVPARPPPTPSPPPRPAQPRVPLTVQEVARQLIDARDNAEEQLQQLRSYQFALENHVAHLQEQLRLAGLVPPPPPPAPSPRLLRVRQSSRHLEAGALDEDPESLAPLGGPMLPPPPPYEEGEGPTPPLHRAPACKKRHHPFHQLPQSSTKMHLSGVLELPRPPHEVKELTLEELLPPTLSLKDAAADRALWKRRQAAYSKIQELLSSPEGEPLFAEYGPVIVGAVSSESNQAAQETLLDLLTTYLAHPGTESCAGEVIGPLIERHLSSTRESLRTKGAGVVMALIRAQQAETILAELVKGAAHKVAKNAVGALAVLLQALRGFGPRVIPPGAILKLLTGGGLFDHRNGDVRVKAAALALEYARWVGKEHASIRGLLGAIKQPALTVSGGGAPPRRWAGQAKDLEDSIKGLPDERPAPTEFLRGQEAQPTAGTPAADSQAAKEEWDPDADAAPVEILAKIGASFYKQLAAEKWQERKVPLEHLLQLADVPKLQPGDYRELHTALKKLFGDPNVVVKGLAIRCMGQLARGLRKEYGPYARQACPALLELFKEKNRPVVTQAHATLLEMGTHCFALAEAIPDLAAALASKVPPVRIETLRFMSALLAKVGPRACPRETLGPLVSGILVRAIDDGVPEVRDGACAIFGALATFHGRESIEPLLAPLDRVKRAKVEAAFPTSPSATTAPAAGAVAPAPAPAESAAPARPASVGPAGQGPPGHSAAPKAAPAAQAGPPATTAGAGKPAAPSGPPPPAAAARRGPAAPPATALAAVAMAAGPAPGPAAAASQPAGGESDGGEDRGPIPEEGALAEALSLAEAARLVGAALPELGPQWEKTLADLGAKAFPVRARALQLLTRHAEAALGSLALPPGAVAPSATAAAAAAAPEAPPIETTHPGVIQLGGEVAPRAFCEALVRVLAEKIGWKAVFQGSPSHRRLRTHSPTALAAEQDSVVAVTSQLLRTIAMLCKACPAFPKRAAAPVIPALVEKLADMKVRQPAGECLHAFCYGFGPQPVFGRLYQAAPKAKAPKGLDGALGWMAAAVEEYGLGAVGGKALLDFAMPLLEATATRPGAIRVIGAIRRFMPGPACDHPCMLLAGPGPLVAGGWAGGGAEELLLQAVGEVKPAVQQHLQAAFAAVADLPPPAPSRSSRVALRAAAVGPKTGGSGAGATAPGGDGSLEEFFPRVDINPALGRLVGRLGVETSKWPEKKAPMDELQRELDQAKMRIQPVTNTAYVPGQHPCPPVRLSADSSHSPRMPMPNCCPLCPVWVPAWVAVVADGEVFVKLKNRLGDSNKAACVLSAQLLANLAKAVGAPIAAHAKVALPALLVAWGDSHTRLSETVAAAMDAWTEAMTLPKMLPYLLAGLTHESVPSRKACLAWAVRVLPQLAPPMPADLHGRLVAVGLARLQEGSPEVRRNAEALLAEAARLGGGWGPILAAHGKLDTASRKLLDPTIRRLAAAEPPATASGAPTPTPTPTPTPSPPPAPSAASPGASGQPGGLPVVTQVQPSTTATVATAPTTPTPSGSAAPAATTVPPAAGGVFKPTSEAAKEARQNRWKMIRWEVRPDRAECVEHCREQLGAALCSEALVARLFPVGTNHQDLHRALAELAAAITAQPREALLYADVLLKWLTVRLCDAITQTLARAVEMLKAFLALMAQLGYTMTEYETAILGPFLFERLPHGGEGFKREFKAIVKGPGWVGGCMRTRGAAVGGAVTPAGRLFGVALQAASRPGAVARPKQEALELMLALLRQAQAQAPPDERALLAAISDLCPAGKFVPLVAPLAVDKDPALRAGALAILATAFAATRNEFWRLLPEIQRKALEDKIRRHPMAVPAAAAAAAAAAPAGHPGSASEEPMGPPASAGPHGAAKAATPPARTLSPAPPAPHGDPLATPAHPRPQSPAAPSTAPQPPTAGGSASPVTVAVPAPAAAAAEPPSELERLCGPVEDRLAGALGAMGRTRQAEEALLARIRLAAAGPPTEALAEALAAPPPPPVADEPQAAPTPAQQALQAATLEELLARCGSRRTACRPPGAPLGWEGGLLGDAMRAAFARAAFPGQVASPQALDPATDAPEDCRPAHRPASGPAPDVAAPAQQRPDEEGDASQPQGSWDRARAMLLDEARVALAAHTTAARWGADILGQEALMGWAATWQATAALGQRAGAPPTGSLLGEAPAALLRHSAKAALAAASEQLFAEALGPAQARESAFVAQCTPSPSPSPAAMPMPGLAGGAGAEVSLPAERAWMERAQRAVGQRAQEAQAEEAAVDAHMKRLSPASRAKVKALRQRLFEDRVLQAQAQAAREAPLSLATLLEELQAEVPPLPLGLALAGMQDARLAEVEGLMGPEGDPAVASVEAAGLPDWSFATRVGGPDSKICPLTLLISQDWHPTGPSWAGRPPLPGPRPLGWAGHPPFDLIYRMRRDFNLLQHVAYNKDLLNCLSTEAFQMLIEECIKVFIAHASMQSACRTVAATGTPLPLPPKRILGGPAPTPALTVDMEHLVRP
ncbi:putative Myotubularin-related protein 2 [Paratrimastix pyriformis]|uniref:Myotubularin-related protein 2 n=1 Tax=Paratrimastix pyriformis TaxID=342808 RepID=A0ABQ8UMM0_9EUKA|nr:putative Myotubularin-related protein 2 [Paratrimastix pyriformis]